MKAYSEERKEAPVRRMMPPENVLVSALVRETGITEQTLYVWRREAKGKGLAVPVDGKNPEGWSSEDNFAVVLEAAPINAAELAEYCRRKGLYPEQIAAWRASSVAAKANTVEQAREQRQQSKEDKQGIKQLEKELHRKEKALAEAAALLVLRKKAQAIWVNKRMTDQRHGPPIMHIVDSRGGWLWLPPAQGMLRAGSERAHVPALGWRRRNRTRRLAVARPIGRTRVTS
ncbi:hypothetical protein OKW43_006429 [Paraburkholderia sp. WC7.3g]